MKKLLITFLALLTVSGAVAQDQPAFPDIPAGHWAADAVNRIADLGIVIGFPDGTFGGNEGFTRYQAALVISRLLNVIADDVAAAQALTAEDLLALRNAVQELTAELATLGVRVGAVEGDVSLLRSDVATFEGRVTAAEVTAEAALARAEAAEAAAQAGVDDTLAAQIEANARGIANLNEVVALLEAEIRALQTGAPTDDAGLDVANIREFVTLLRRDQVADRERIAALEEQVAGLTGLEERVTQLERDILTLSGSLTLTYVQGNIAGTTDASFDVDRIFGLGQRRETSPSVFTTGAGTTPARAAQERSDIFQTPGQFTSDANVNFGFGIERTLAGAGVGGLDAFDAVLELGLRRAFNLCANADCTQTFNGFVFELRNVLTTIDVAGAGPIQFQFGEAPQATFTPYVFQTLGPGFVATLGAPDFLAFLDPTLTVSYGSARRTVNIEGTDNVQVLGPQTYYFGLRGTLSPFAGLTGGFSLAQLERFDATGGFVGSATSVFGVDANLSLGFISLAGEFARSEGRVLTTGVAVDGVLPVIGDLGSDGTTDLFYVTATISGENLPLLNDLTANYRDMPPANRGAETVGLPGAGYFGVEFGAEGDKPFRFDQTGFGLNTSIDVFILTVDVYFDSYSVAAGTDVVAYGASTSIDLFAGFAARGFYREVTADGARVRSVGGFDGLRRTEAYESAFGAGLAHDGGAENALIPGLNLNFEYALLGNPEGFTTPRLTAEADYSLNVAGFALDPYVAFVNTTGNPLGYDNTTVRAGTSVRTEPLEVFLRPALEAAVNYRTTALTAGVDGAPDYTATEMQYSVGLSLDEFLFENSTFSARYGFYEGVNMSLARTTPDTPNAAGYATRIHETQFNGATQTTSGFELAWNYFDLEFAYGMYARTIAGAVGDFAGENRDQTGTRFRVRYVINF